MTKILSWAFVFLWASMAVKEAIDGDMFHMVTSTTISLWNISFLNDLRKMEKANGKTP